MGLEVFDYEVAGQMNLFDYFNDKPPLKIRKEIRLIEMFAGVGSQLMALKRIGAKVIPWRAYEIDKYACLSYNAIHGTDIQPTDIRTVKGGDLGITNTDEYCYILTYSFP